MKLQNYSFTLEIANYTNFDDDLVNRVSECGCDDGSFSVIDGKLYFDVDREADSLNQAIASVIRQLQWEAIHVKSITSEEGKVILPSSLGTLQEFTLVFDGVFDEELADKLYATGVVKFICSKKGKTHLCIETIDVTLENAVANAIKQLKRKFDIEVIAAYEELLDGDESYESQISLDDFNSQ